MTFLKEFLTFPQLLKKNIFINISDDIFVSHSLGICHIHPASYNYYNYNCTIHPFSMFHPSKFILVTFLVNFTPIFAPAALRKLRLRA